MANQLEEKEIEEGYTEFGGGLESRYGSFFNPAGALGKWFAKFFATKAVPYLSDTDSKGSDLTGDTLISPEHITATDKNEAMTFGMSRGSFVSPQIELNRKRRYEEYEKMDEYPEIGAAFDIYSDDSTQKDLRNRRWIVKSESTMVIEEVQKLFKEIELERLYWDVIRNTVKYGDCFIELILDIDDPKSGIQRVKILNPKYILRVENQYGYLMNFLQEIPEKQDNIFYSTQNNIERSKFIELDKNQIVHFRLHSSDPLYYPYGKSIAALSHRIFRSLKLMEDAMLIYRLSRAPERRVFYVDVGNLPASKSEVFIERLKAKFKKEKFYNANTGQIDAKYNPLSADEDFFVPLRGQRGTKIETLPGAQNLGEVDDVKYFRDKLLASLKVPKDYMVEKDKSPERKANLSQLDVKFARTITRIQNSIEYGLESIAKKHLMMLGYPVGLVQKVRIDLPDPSDMFTQRKLALDLDKATVVQTVLATGLFSKNKILKEYYDMTDEEIAALKKEQEKEMEEDPMQGGMPPAPGGPAPAAPGGPMPGTPAPPTREEALKTLKDLKSKILKEDDFSLRKVKTVDKIIKRFEDKSNS